MPALRLTVLLALACLLSPAGDAHSEAETVRVKTSAPGGTAPLLSAPHTGKTLCEIADGTPVAFVRRADHGPHRFAEVQVKEGDCAGVEGYVSWTALDPRPE